MLKALLRDSFIYGLSSILSKGLVIFLLPLYTRVLSPGEYGAYDLLITFGVLANLVVALEVSQGLARYWAETSELGARRRLASTSLVFTVLMYGIFLFAVLLFAPWLNIWLLGDEAHLSVFRLGIGYIVANGIYCLLLNQFRWELRSKTYALVNFGYAFLTLILTAMLCLSFRMGLEGVMLAQFLSAVCFALVSLWLLRNTFGFCLDFSQLASLLRFSAPLVPASLAVFLSLYINRFALSHFAGLEAVGLFGIANRIAGLSALLIIGVQAALTPLVYQHYREPGTPLQIARLFGWFSAVALVGCFFLALFAKELLTLFATVAYLEAAPLVAILAPALLLSQMYIFAPGIAIAKKTFWQLGVTVASALVSIVGNWFLVPVWGAWGAALATLLASLAFFLCWLALSQRLYRIPYRWQGCLLAVFAFVILVVLGGVLDGSELPSIVVGFLKSMLLVALMTLVVLCKLLPFSDIRQLLLNIKRYLASRRLAVSCREGK